VNGCIDHPFGWWAILDEGGLYLMGYESKCVLLAAYHGLR
jgi:hypothetical protein